jgi:hypothetical protein
VVGDAHEEVVDAGYVAVMDHATSVVPEERFPTYLSFAAAWHATARTGHLGRTGHIDSAALLQ